MAERMDIERVVATWLQAVTDMPARLDVPSERPEQFYTVTLAATTGERFKKRVRVIVQSWAKTRREAKRMASLAEDVCPVIEEQERNVFSCVADGTYRWDDPETETPRYQTAFNIYICE